MRVKSLGREDPLEKEMATHSNILAWETPRTEGLGRLQSMDCKELDRTERLNKNNKVLGWVKGTYSQLHDLFSYYRFPFPFLLSPLILC